LGRAVPSSVGKETSVQSSNIREDNLGTSTQLSLADGSSVHPHAGNNIIGNVELSAGDSIDDFIGSCGSCSSGSIQRHLIGPCFGVTGSTEQESQFGSVVNEFSDGLRWKGPIYSELGAWKVIVHLSNHDSRDEGIIIDLDVSRELLGSGQKEQTGKGEKGTHSQWFLSS